MSDSRSEAEAERQPGEEPDLVRLVTIGVPLGTTINPETKVKEGMLRHGHELMTFDADAYKVLYLAGGPRIRSDLVQRVGRHQVADPEAVIERCLEAGLLREIDFDSRMPDDRWGDLRLAPIGMGRGIDENDVCRIDVPGRGTVEVDRFAYSVWAASDGRSIREVVDALAADIGPARLALSSHWGVSSLDTLDRMAQAVVARPELAGDFVGSAIPRIVMALMIRGAAYLDTAT